MNNKGKFNDNKAISILLKRLLSLCDLENNIIVAAPVESPETKNKGPKMALFHNGLALKADSSIPV